MLILQNLSYTHPNQDVLFRNLNLSLHEEEKIALVGNNGRGKSTLLRLIAGYLQPYGGQISLSTAPYYVPQHVGQYDHMTVAEALQVSEKLQALHGILQGDTSGQNFYLLNEDWTIEERCREALRYWQVGDLQFDQTMQTLSGGQKTKVFLAGIRVHHPSLILLDEPSNHLDAEGRALLYDLVRNTRCSMLMVTHDRALLDIPDVICELTIEGITRYGGNYAFYKAQKQIEQQALTEDIQSSEKALRKAKEKERETQERQQKLNSRGRGKQEQAGVARIMMNTLRNQAENSTARLRSAHTEKIDGITQQLQELRSSLSGIEQMRFGFADSGLHQGKVLFRCTDTNFSYGTKFLWQSNLNLEIVSGERLAIKGNNGAGKTSLIRLILGALMPQRGTIYRAIDKAIYIDQDYSLLDNERTVFGQAQQFNTAALLPHEIGIRLTRFLFAREDWDKSCSSLSGGERMRLVLCCITIDTRQPDLIILDEPTNNLDLQNIEILTAAVNLYRGTLIVVSHDEVFLKDIGIERVEELKA